VSPIQPRYGRTLSAVLAAGFTASRVFTGWDGAATDRGPWLLQMLTIDRNSSATANHTPPQRPTAWSTTMYANGQVINTTSDATGERPVGDTILPLPTR
jgi:hypothetical protein